MGRSIPAIVLAIGIVSSAAAAPVTVELDADHTTVSFVLGATLHKVRGEFRLEGGRVTYDPRTAEASGEVVVDASSGDSGNARRDRDMHAKVLESEAYPTIVLRPVRIDGRLPDAGEARLTIVGSLEIHGTRHDVEIPVTVTVDGAAIRISAEFEVPYVDWGLHDPSKLLLRVDKRVTVSVEAAATMASGDF